jgi:hypothetical protein
LLRVPCDLDLGDAEDRAEAERLYVEQASALRDALVGADPGSGRRNLRPPPPDKRLRPASLDGDPLDRPWRKAALYPEPQ